MREELLLVASRLLSYPDDHLEDAYEDIREISLEYKSDCPELEEATEAIFSLPPGERQQLYVSTFDLKQKHALYLSAHEFGDSPKRGAALIRLQKIVNEAGFEREDGELADFIPMLLELMAVAESSPDIEHLAERLSFAVHEIHVHVPTENPYHKILDCLMTHALQVPSKEQIESLKRNREEADLEELPYPLLYQ